MLLFTGLLLICRSGLKHKANKQHEREKDFMGTLQYVDIDSLTPPFIPLSLQYQILRTVMKMDLLMTVMMSPYSFMMVWI